MSQRGSTEADRHEMARVILVAVATLLMLQAVRVFVSYLVFVIDQANRGMLAAVAFGVFLAIGLAPLVWRLLGTRHAVLLSLAGLAVARLGVQFWELPEARLVLAALVVVCWGWLVILMIAVDRSATALGLPLGLGLDLAVRIAFFTVDLPWIPGVVAHTVTVAIVIAGAIAAIRILTSSLPSSLAATSPVSLIGLGPGLVVYHLVTGNLGFAQTALDRHFPLAAMILAVGTVLGLVALPSLATGVGWSGRSGRLEAIGIGSLAGIGLLLFWRGGSFAVIGALIATAMVMLLLWLVLQGSGASPAGLASITVWFTGGLLLHVALLFVYYTYTGLPSIVALAWAMLALATMLATLGKRVASDPSRFLPVGAVCLLLLFACLGRWIAWERPAAAEPLPSRFTTMTYNLQAGFSLDDAWDLEATARTIEAANPDLVVLQEVSRGWLITSGVDEVLWLSHRLEMPVVFGASSGDGLWGNAILSRAPIQDAAIHRFTTTQNLDRGMVEVRLATETGDLWVFGTHLDDPIDAGSIRLAQVTELLAGWDGRTPAVVAGDFNAEPESDVLRALAGAGFVDTGRASGENGPTSEDGRRIDYVLVTPGITVGAVRVLPATTSDHNPVLAALELVP